MEMPGVTWQIEAGEGVRLCPQDDVGDFVDDPLLSQVLPPMGGVGQRRHHLYARGSATQKVIAVYFSWALKHSVLKKKRPHPKS